MSVTQSTHLNVLKLNNFCMGFKYENLIVCTIGISEKGMYRGKKKLKFGKSEKKGKFHLMGKWLSKTRLEYFQPLVYALFAEWSSH